MAKITSVSEYIRQVTCLDDERRNTDLVSNKRTERYYRGLSSIDYINKDMPKIFREGNENFLKNERKIYYEYIAKLPHEFENCRNTFEHLTLMQHYGLPTRLLDVTANPLVALYFACMATKNPLIQQHGAVVLYDFEEKHILDHNHKFLHQISYLSQTNENFNSVMLCLIKEAHILKLNAKKLTLEIFRDVDELNNKRKKSFNLHYKALIEKPCKKIESCIRRLGSLYKMEVDIRKIMLNRLLFSKNELATLLNPNRLEEDKRDEIVDLLNIIQQTATFLHEKSKYSLLFNVYDNDFETIYSSLEEYDNENLSVPFCVKPKLEDFRIVNQRGAFIILGCDSETGSKVFTSTPHFKFRPKTYALLIDENSKKNILRELNLYGINKAFLFPDLENIAETIQEKYARESERGEHDSCSKPDNYDCITIKKITYKI